MPARTLRLPLLVAALVAALPLAAQPVPWSPDSLTAADYARAERFLPQNVFPLVRGLFVNPSWVDGSDRFTYAAVGDSTAFVVVDPRRRTRAAAFDAARVAAGLSAATGQRVTAGRLPFQSFTYADGGRAIAVDVGERQYTCVLRTGACTDAGARRETAAWPPPPEVRSPDGRLAAFIRDWNLWVRDVATGAETPLTTDGTEHNGYATDNAGWRKSDRPVLLWSPDSRRIATQQQDERGVSEMVLVGSNVGAPRVERWRYPFPGDSTVAMIRRVVIDVPSRRVTALQMEPDYHRAMFGDDLDLNDLSWSPDGRELAFVSTDRAHKSATVRLADAETGAVRTLFTETEEAHFESVAGWRVLWGSREIVWTSQRDDWANLYLYSLDTGALKNAITTGEGPVAEILRVDEDAREVWYVAQGRAPGQNPYFRHAFRAPLGGGAATWLTPDVGDHTVRLAPSGRYLLDTYSTPEVPPVTVVRGRDGRQVMEVERADVSRLLATGWRPPTVVTAKAPDGVTDLYGLLFRPTAFDSTRAYPVVNYGYPGPLGSSVSSWSFQPFHGDNQALAELGFVVVSINGLGTLGRSQSFANGYYGAMGRDNGVPSQVGAMQQLAARYPWIDVERAGIWGHSGGGFLAAAAMFRYPDFFKVGVAQAGNHDQRNYEDDWGERYQGLLERLPDGSDSYAAEANQTVAANLKGKLLLAHGMMDDNVPFSNTMLVAQALIDAGKDFDLILFPNARHGFGRDNNYMTRRRWDYFVRWLLGAEPPDEYRLGARR